MTGVSDLLSGGMGAGLAGGNPYMAAGMAGADALGKALQKPADNSSPTATATQGGHNSYYFSTTGGSTSGSGLLSSAAIMVMALAVMAIVLVPMLKKGKGAANG